MVRAFLWADSPSSNNKVLRDYKISLGCCHLCRSGNHRSAQNLGCNKKNVHELLLCCAKFHQPTAGDEATSNSRFFIPLTPFAWNTCSSIIQVSTLWSTNINHNVHHSFGVLITIQLPNLRRF